MVVRWDKVADLLHKVDDLVDLSWLGEEVVDLGGGLLADSAGVLERGLVVGLEWGWESNDLSVQGRAAEWSAQLSAVELVLDDLEEVRESHRGVALAESGDIGWELRADVIHDELGDLLLGSVGLEVGLGPLGGVVAKLAHNGVSLWGGGDHRLEGDRVCKRRKQKVRVRG